MIFEGVRLEEEGHGDRSRVLDAPRGLADVARPPAPGEEPGGRARALPCRGGGRVERGRERLAALAGGPERGARRRHRVDHRLVADLGTAERPDGVEPGGRAHREHREVERGLLPSGAPELATQVSRPACCSAWIAGFTPGTACSGASRKVW